MKCHTTMSLEPAVPKFDDPLPWSATQGYRRQAGGPAPPTQSIDDVKNIFAADLAQINQNLEALANCVFPGFGPTTKTAKKKDKEDEPDVDIQNCRGTNLDPPPCPLACNICNEEPCGQGDENHDVHPRMQHRCSDCMDIGDPSASSSVSIEPETREC